MHVGVSRRKKATKKGGKIRKKRERQRMKVNFLFFFFFLHGSLMRMNYFFNDFFYGHKIIAWNKSYKDKAKKIIN